MEKYTLDSFLRVHSQVECFGKVFYLRTLGSRQDEFRSQYAMSYARAYKTKLGDVDSQEYAFNIVPLKNATIDEIYDLALALERVKLNRASQVEVVPQYEPRPSENSELVDIIETEDRKEEEDKTLVERRLKFVEDGLEQFKKQNDKSSIDKEAFRSSTIERQISLLVERTYGESWIDATLVGGVFTDEKCRKQLFSSVEDVADCHPKLRDELASAYMALDIFSANSEELKNLSLGQ